MPQKEVKKIKLYKIRIRIIKVYLISPFVLGEAENKIQPVGITANSVSFPRKCMLSHSEHSWFIELIVIVQGRVEVAILDGFID